MKPRLLLSDPSTVSAKEPNNFWMKAGTKFDMGLAWEQWEHLYEELAKEATLYLLPAEGPYQDRPYVANVGATIEKHAIISRFKSKPRQGEEIVARQFLQALGYKTHWPPSFWEGEADLKHIHNKVFFGGYGQRSDPWSYLWMEDELNLFVIPIKMEDPKLYHLDCILMPLPNGKILCQKGSLPYTWDRIEIPEKFRYDSWTNSLIIGNKWFYYTTDDGDHKSRAALEQIAQKEEYHPIYINLSEFEKSGAALSCMVMHLN